MKSFFFFLTALLCVALAGLRRWLFNPLVADMANAIAGTVLCHDGDITRKAEVAFTSAHLLVAQGTATDEVKLATASVKPIGSIDDTYAIDDNDVKVQLLGSNRTHVLTASEEIDPGEDVYATAGGKVSLLPVGAGTYQFVGVALTYAAADGSELEVATSLPRPVVVT